MNKTIIYIAFALSALCLARVHAEENKIVLAEAFPAIAPMPASNHSIGTELRRHEAMRPALIRDVVKESNGLSYTLSEKAPVSITLYTMNGDVVKTWDLKPGAHGAQAGLNNFQFPSLTPGTYMTEIAVGSAYGVYTVTERITLP